MTKKAKSVLDKFSNKARLAVTMSAADTISFNELVTGVSFYDNVAWIVHRIEYTISVTSVGLMTASGDLIELGVTTRDTLVSLATNQSEVIDTVGLFRMDMGAAASGVLLSRPLIHDFTALPGGGLVIPAESLFAAMDSSGLAAAANGTIVVWFTYLPVTDANYLDLLNAFRVIR